MEEDKIEIYKYNHTERQLVAIAKKDKIDGKYYVGDEIGDVKSPKIYVVCLILMLLFYLISANIMYDNAIEKGTKIGYNRAKDSCNSLLNSSDKKHYDTLNELNRCQIDLDKYYNFYKSTRNFTIVYHNLSNGFIIMTEYDSDIFDNIQIESNDKIDGKSSNDIDNGDLFMKIPTILEYVS